MCDSFSQIDFSDAPSGTVKNCKEGGWRRAYFLDFNRCKSDHSKNQSAVSTAGMAKYGSQYCLPWIRRWQKHLGFGDRRFCTYLFLVMRELTKSSMQVHANHVFLLIMKVQVGTRQECRMFPIGSTQQFSRSFSYRTRTHKPTVLTLFVVSFVVEISY